MIRGSRGSCLALLALATAVLGAACGRGSATETGREREAAAAARLEAIEAKLEGLAPQARRRALIEMAEAEGGELNDYGSLNLDEAEPIIEAFEDATGIKVNLYRASSGDVLQRLLQEAEANFPGADVVNISGPEMSILDKRGLLLPLRTPATEDIVDYGVFDTWAALYLNAFTASWNTKRVSPGERPKTWEQVLTGFRGRLAMEAGDFDWFATLVTQYFQKRRGMSEEEAIRLFKDAAAGGRMVDGHTLMAELLTAGEFDVAASTYKHRVAQLKADGAPVEWEPPVEPVVVRPIGIGIVATTPRPATALLFVEFMLTDAQAMLLEYDRTPASRAVPGGGIPEEYDVLPADLEMLFNERDRWEGAYDEVARQSKGEVIGE